MTAEQMAALTVEVLARFVVELAEADTRQLQHLAQRAEARYSTALGEQMRGLVNDEQDRRLKRAIETSPLQNRYRTWVR